MLSFWIIEHLDIIEKVLPSLFASGVDFSPNPPAISISQYIEGANIDKVVIILVFIYG